MLQPACELEPVQGPHTGEMPWPSGQEAGSSTPIHSHVRIPIMGLEQGLLPTWGHATEQNTRGAAPYRAKAPGERHRKEGGREAAGQTTEHTDSWGPNGSLLLPRPPQVATET